MISEPFELVQLPRFSQKNVNSVATCTDSEFLYLGASGSSISKLSLRPPQVLHTHSISPNVVISSLLASDGQIKAYGSLERSKHILHVLSSGQTMELNEAALNLFSNEGAIGVLTKSKMHVFTADDDLVSVWENATEELVFSARATTDDAAILTVHKLRTGALSATVWALTSSGFHKLSQNTLLGVDYTGKTHFSFYESRLYVAQDATIRAFSVPEIQPLGELDVTGDVKSVIALPQNNLLVVRGNEVQQLDFTFQSQVSSLKIPSGINSLLDFVEESSTVVALQGKAVVGIQVVPTSGTLLESIGKGFTAKPEFPLVDIFDAFKGQPSQFKQTAVSQLKESEAESERVMRDLEKFIEQRDGPSFGAIVAYLKSPGKPWTEVLDEQNGMSDDLVFEEADDRNADRRVVVRACELAFLPRLKPYLPIGVAVYLLTHPLFPLNEPKFAKLLPSLEQSDSTLYRQALVSLTGISVVDLVRGLLNSDEETFLDAATRLQEDYSSPQILKGLRTAFRSMRSTSSLSVLIERLSRYPQTIGLVTPFVDAMGLLAWNVDSIKDLHEQLDLQIDSLEQNVKAATAISDLFSTLGLNPTAPEAKRTSGPIVKGSDTRRVPKYSIETLVL